MATGQCNARQIQLADPATRQGTGLNACGGQGMKGTKLCDRNLERGDGSKLQGRSAARALSLFANNLPSFTRRAAP